MATGREGYKYTPGGSQTASSCLYSARSACATHLPWPNWLWATSLTSLDFKTSALRVSPYRLCWCKIIKIAPNGNHTFSCIPLWILEDIKAYIKKSTNRKANVNSSEVPISQVTMKDDRNPCQSGPLRVAVLGAGEVGKSALTVRYLTKRFIGEYRSDTGKDQNEPLRSFFYNSPLFNGTKVLISLEQFKVIAYS